MAEANDMNIEAIAKRCVEICEAHKAADIRLFDVREKTILADYFIVCSGTSMPHLRAIADSVRRAMQEEGIRPRGRDGSPTSQWIVLDYGVLVVHVLTPDMRRRYALENLWDTSLVVYSGGAPLPPPLGGAAEAELPPPEELDGDYPLDGITAGMGDSDAN